MSVNELVLLPQCWKDQSTSLHAEGTVSALEKAQTAQKGVGVVLKARKNPAKKPGGDGVC